MRAAFRCDAPPCLTALSHPMYLSYVLYYLHRGVRRAHQPSLHQCTLHTPLSLPS